MLFYNRCKICLIYNCFFLLTFLLPAFLLLTLLLLALTLLTILIILFFFWLIPSLYLKATGYFEAFFIQNPYIKKTVTGMFEIILSDTIKLHLILLIIGVVLIISTLVIHYAYIHYLKKKHQKERGID